MIDINSALHSLCPNAQWVLTNYDYENIRWVVEPTSIPTLQEVEAEVARLQVEYDAKEYQRVRAKQYPSIADQLDMLWHAIDTNSLDKNSSFYTTLKAVKDANAKP
jgi:hypothetical protein